MKVASFIHKLLHQQDTNPKYPLYMRQGWFPRAVWTLWITKKYPSRSRNRSTIPRSCNPQPGSYWPTYPSSTNKNNFIPIHPTVWQGLLRRTVSREIAFTKKLHSLNMSKKISPNHNAEYRFYPNYHNYLTWQHDDEAWYGTGTIITQYNLIPVN